MPIARRNQTEIQSKNTPIYRSSFVCHSHEILKMGYDRLVAPAFSEHEEEAITGELTRAMLGALEDRDAPKWAKHLWVIEEARVHDPSRLGKRRLRIDIEFIWLQDGPKPRFRFEAKRLNDASSRRKYLGEDGVSCFLDGRYAKEDEIAGMLGYVQKDSIASHVTALERTLKSDQKRYAVTGDQQWTVTPIIKELTTYRTTHNRSNSLPPIVLLHTFLSFTDTA